MKKQTFTRFILCTSFILLGRQALAASSNSHSLSLYDHPTPYLSDADLPGRTPPIEFGDPMLGPGKITPGEELGSGAILDPRLWIYGTFALATQTFRTGAGPATTELTSRLDLFANLQLSGTERILLGMQPLHENDCFTSYIFKPTENRGYKDGVNGNITTLFFEGDLGEMFPNLLAKRGYHGGDLGFAVGRQVIFFQDGIFINDRLDAVAITQNNLLGDYFSNLQLSVYVGLDDVDRSNNQLDKNSTVYGFHSQMDTEYRTVAFDIAFVEADVANVIVPTDPNNVVYQNGDLLLAGISSVQRMSQWGVTLRLLGSHAADNRDNTQANDGLLVFVETNTAPNEVDSIFYVNAAMAAGHFTSVARDPTVGGPLGRLGILFASTGIGSLGSPLNSVANYVLAGAIGYQRFYDEDYQTIFEVGGRVKLNEREKDSLGVALRLQKGIKERFVARVDLFAAVREDQNAAYGVSGSLLMKI